ncbi:MAG TPA: carbohydrate kinase family protein [Aggregatilineales bacterium]|nr:carbohydrate kinase family protein [Aggregatilineales bacterium]
MRIVVTGSIAYDYLMRFPGKFKDHLLADSLHQISVSFLVDQMTRHFGGTGANIAFNLALMGQKPCLMGTAGKDFADYRAWLESVGVNTRSVMVEDDVFTASFFANTDEENNQIASFYGGAMAYARKYTLQATVEGTPDYVIVSPNDPEAMRQIVEECIQRGIRYMYDPSQQLPRTEPETLRRAIEHCHTLIVNEYEWSMLLKKTGLTRGDILKQAKTLVITQGKKGAEIYAENQYHNVPIFPLPDGDIADPTGVGDAFRAGIMCGIRYGWSWEVAGRVGALCSAYALERVGTQNHFYTLPEFVARYRTAFDDEGALDVLLEPEVSAS